MPVLKNIAAIAKGMSITFLEMFQPTTVENYPDGEGPVSYTHLDVYKRQTYRRQQCHFVTRLQRSLCSGILLINRHGQRSQRLLYPVSYTHLPSA